MENYKIKRNPKPISDEQINRHKDFNNLLTKHQKTIHTSKAVRPLYKNPGFMSMMIVIGIVLLMLVLDRSEEKPSTPAKDSVGVLKGDTGLGAPTEQNKKDPVESTNTNKTNSTNNKDLDTNRKNTNTTAYEIFKVDPEKGTVLYTKSGARLLIPAFAFFDEKGNVTKKEVRLHYKEYTEMTFQSDKTIIPQIAFEITAEESISLTQPIIIEVINPINEGKGTVYKYFGQKDKWEIIEPEKYFYRYKIEADESIFPEMKYLKKLVWELPAEAGKPSDFNYIFNRPWKNFYLQLSGKKEIALKNPQSSFKVFTDNISMLGNKKEDTKLKEAFYTLYNFDSGKIKNTEVRKQALILIESWMASEEGKKYIEWSKNQSPEGQLSSTQKTSQLILKSFGYIGIGYTSNKMVSTKPSPRILVLEKDPEKTQYFNKHNLNEDPNVPKDF